MFIRGAAFGFCEQLKLPLEVCVFRRNDEILAAETPDSVKGDTFWGPPGGRIEFGETAAQGAEREMLEELDFRFA